MGEPEQCGGLELGVGRRHCLRRERDVSPDQIGEALRGALVGDQLELQTGLASEQFADQVAHAADA